jgi:cytochrome c551/c552/cytochrome b subunit of formate dehydrogenase
MKRISLALVLLGILFAGTAGAQAGADLLNAKGCLGCHGVAEKKMGPALKDAFGKYRGAEARLAAALKAGKGHPMPVDVSDADVKAMMAHVLGAAETKPAAAAKAAPNLLESKGCLGCHGVDEKKMGPALKDAFAKYRGAEAKLAAALKAGKGHPVPVDVSEADVRAIAAQLGAKPATKPAPAAAAATVSLDNATCLGCHANAGFEAPGRDGAPRSLHVQKERFEHSVHGKRQCVDCHADITEVPHQPVARRQVSCITCHDDLWKAAQREGKTKENARLGIVVEQIDRYMKSVHARPNRDDQSRTNATCYNCHSPHYVYPVGTQQHTEWRLNIPNTCGTCHWLQRQAYATSVHGKEVLEKKNPAAAVCSDCHSPHDIDRPAQDTMKVAITKNCGGCHEKSYETYRQTYHGQVHSLGYAYTAKCYDCHGSHAVQRVSDPNSSVHANNRLTTCRTCHENATAGFVTFQPHASTANRERYPAMWATANFMLLLIVGVFLFFWTHCALWFYREYRDRKEGKHHQRVLTAELPAHLQGKHFQRFRPVWRVAHLLFALSLMTLSVTGMAAFYAETAWAGALVRALGGPQSAAIIHRIAGVLILTIFLAQLIHFVVRLAPQWRTFNWFGHTSLVPGIQDAKDMIAMFKWFFGLGPRPVFGRWTYWERFDYWAPFWGLAIVGGSGLMLWFKEATAALLPGWVFNVATLAHGEEAFLAIVFLFTVHFFNNHFRPDKLPPPDIVMFTGTQSLEEFAREHTLEYQELLRNGELEKRLVDVPSRAMTVGSRILGIVLLGFGLTILTLVLIGFFGSL